MRVIRLIQEGVINKDGPVFVNPGDFLLALEDNEELNYYPEYF